MRALPAIAAVAMMLAGCTDTRPQWQRDHERASILIDQRLGEYQPYGRPIIYNTFRSPLQPDVICGYWDSVGLKIPNTFTPFAIKEDGTNSQVFGINKTWLDSGAPTSSQWSWIEYVCGDKLPFPTELSGKPLNR